MLIVFLEACEGYACPPDNKVPASEVIVKTFTDLATTGGEANTAGIVIAGCFVVAGGLLFLYNHLKGKERRDHD